MSGEPRRAYLAFLLRLWQVRSETGPTWRASLENARNGERLGFAGLEELFGFLQRRTAEEEMHKGRVDCDKQPPDLTIQ
jgi:hypothetical protein